MSDTDEQGPTQDQKTTSTARIGEPTPATASERFLAVSGVCLIMSSVVSFISIIYIEFKFGSPLLGPGARWIDFLSVK